MVRGTAHLQESCASGRVGVFDIKTAMLTSSSVSRTPLLTESEEISLALLNVVRESCTELSSKSIRQDHSQQRGQRTLWLSEAHVALPQYKHIANIQKFF